MTDFAADWRLIANNHRGGVDTTERLRQSCECSFEEQTRSRTAFRRYRVGKALVEAFDHHVKRDVTLQLLEAGFHGGRVD